MLNTEPITARVLVGLYDTVEPPVPRREAFPSGSFTQELVQVRSGTVTGDDGAVVARPVGPCSSPTATGVGSI